MRIGLRLLDNIVHPKELDYFSANALVNEFVSVQPLLNPALHHS